MAIDTASKRKGVLNFSLPGAKSLPIPDGTVSVLDRRQMTDSYPINATVIAIGGWSNDNDSNTIWKQDNDSSEFWVQDNDSSEVWVKDHKGS